MSMRIKGFLAAGLVAAAGGPAFASTEVAWQEFRDRTEPARLALLPEGAAAELSGAFAPSLRLSPQAAE